MRFLVDMGIGLDVVEALRTANHDAVHLGEQGLQRLPDGEILAKAAAENRIVITHDLDMSRLIAVAGAHTPSLITFRLSDMRPVEIIPRLIHALRVFSSQLTSGAALTASDHAIRCHPLPLREAEE